MSQQDYNNNNPDFYYYFKKVIFFEFAKKHPIIFFIAFTFLTFYLRFFTIIGGWTFAMLLVFGVIPIIIILDIIVVIQLSIFKKLKFTIKYSDIIFYLYSYSLSQFLAFVFLPDADDNSSYTFINVIANKFYGIPYPYPTPEYVNYFFYISLILTFFMISFYILLQKNIYKARRELKK